MALGGGCEISLHARRIHAAAEAYIGLVETGVGLIPGGGGTKEMLIRANEHAAGGEDLDLFHAMKPIFENVAMAKVSTSAEDARGLGYLRPADLISMNRDRLVADAKATALAMVRAGYHPPAPAEIRVLGEEFLAAAKLAIHLLVRGGYASEYDAVVGRKLAYILAGAASRRRKLCPSNIFSTSNARPSSACAASARPRSALRTLSRPASLCATEGAGPRAFACR